MGTVNEIFSSTREGSVDVKSGQMTRVFQVSGTTRDNATIEPGIPQLGSPFAFGGRIVYADNYSVRSTVSPDVTEVTVSYSSDGRGKLPPRIDDTSITFNSVSMSFVRDERRIPAFRRRPIEQTRIDAPPVGPPIAQQVLVDSWEPYDFTITSYYSQLRVRCNVSRFSTTDYAIVSGQVDKIHLFGPNATGYTGLRPGGPVNSNKMCWKFIGCQADQVEPERWELTYNWISDSGAGPFTYLITGSDYNIIAPTESRYAFESYYVIPAGAPGGNPDFPEVEAAPSFDFGTVGSGAVGMGYEELPGRPIR